MIPVYVINLARCPERRVWMERQLVEGNVEAQIIVAVDGRRCRRDAQTTTLRRLSIAETAVILSHRKAWRALLASGEAAAVVLEDDVCLGRGFTETLARDWSRQDYDLVKLETMFDRVWLSRVGEQMGGRRLHRLGAEHHGSAAYIISRAGALKMLHATRALNEPVDISLFGRRAVFSGSVDARQIVPAVAAQMHVLACAGARDFVSTLQADRKLAPRRKLRFLELLRREALRLVEQSVRVARLAPTMRRCRVEFDRRDCGSPCRALSTYSLSPTDERR